MNKSVLCLVALLGIISVFALLHYSNQNHPQEILTEKNMISEGSLNQIRLPLILGHNPRSSILGGVDGDSTPTGNPPASCGTCNSTNIGIAGCCVTDGSGSHQYTCGQTTDGATWLKKKCSNGCNGEGAGRRCSAPQNSIGDDFTGGEIRVEYRGGKGGAGGENY